MIQIHRLEGFYRVALAGGFTRAAKTFPYPITQPGVSLQVRRLEDDLGVRLFERVGRDQVSLTPAGERLYAFAAPFFEELPEVCESLRASRHGGTLRVDASPLEIRFVLPAWFQALRKARPDIQIELEEIGAVSFERLARRRADVLVEVVPDVPSGFRSKQVGTHYTFIVVPEGSALGKKARLGLTDLRDQPFVAFHPSLPQAALQLRALAAKGPAPKILSASSTDAILGFVAAGLGCSLVPWPLVAGPQVSGVRAVRLRHPEAEFPILAVWKERERPNPVLEAALSCFPSLKAR